MKTTIEGYDEIREKMKGVRLPSRRWLAREPWDVEQLRIFCMRQSRITEHWARLGLSGFKELWLQPDGSYSEEVPERYLSSVKTKKNPPPSVPGVAQSGGDFRFLP